MGQVKEFDDRAYKQTLLNTVSQLALWNGYIGYRRKAEPEAYVGLKTYELSDKMDAPQK